MAVGGWHSVKIGGSRWCGGAGAPPIVWSLRELGSQNLQRNICCRGCTWATWEKLCLSMLCVQNLY